VIVSVSPGVRAHAVRVYEMFRQKTSVSVVVTVLRPRDVAGSCRRPSIVPLDGDVLLPKTGRMVTDVTTIQGALGDSHPSTAGVTRPVADRPA
jgi:hypothetical protein